MYLLQLATYEMRVARHFFAESVLFCVPLHPHKMEVDAEASNGAAAPRRRRRQPAGPRMEDQHAEKKRSCCWIKSWWESCFDEESFKFRKLNRHHDDAEPWH
jgi:hypothetical protein